MTTTMPELRFDSKPENIAVVERLIDQISEDHGIIPEHYGNVFIAMTEGVNNAIVHGNKLDPEKSVSVSCAIDEKNLVFRIPTKVLDSTTTTFPTPRHPKTSRSPTAAVCSLMRHLADECAFEDDGRIVELTFSNVFA